MLTTRHLRLTINVFQSGKTYVMEGLPISATIEKTGGEGLQHARIKVSGLGRMTLEALTVVEFTKKATRVNEILLEARSGDELSYSVAFAGNAICALPVIGTNGTVDLEIEANSGWLASIMRTPPVSVKTPVAASKMFAMFATEGGLILDNRLLRDAMVQNSVFVGSPRKKAQQLARQIGCDCFIDDKRLVVRDFSVGTNTSGIIPIVSVSNGMIGYPKFTRNGVSVSSIYSPLFCLGDTINVVSTIPQANGPWIVCKLTHKLDAYQPSGGSWFSDIETYQPGGVNPYGR